MLRRVIGDVHGKMAQYIALTQGCEHSIQVGDFGAGFVDLPHLLPQHTFIRGNHDDPAICKAHPNWIADGTLEGDILYIGGAYSTDQGSRTIGRDWWRDEELSFQELNALLNVYAQHQPRVMITHEAPHDVMKKIWKHTQGGSRTGRAFEAMFDIHKPELWFFGHHHDSQRPVIGGTQFFCLAELEYIDIDF